MKKDELLTENSRLLAKNSELNTRDDILRKRFAKVLNRTERDVYSPSIGTTVSNLSWEEIFYEIGKLMAFQDFRRWKDDMDIRMDMLARERSDASNLNKVASTTAQP